MGKSMEYRPNLIGPPLAKGLFKPDLLALCAKYDSNIKAYKTLVQRKKNASVYLDQLAATAKSYMQEWNSVEAQFQSSDKENLATTQAAAAKVKAFAQQGDSADTTEAAAALAAYAGEVKKYLDTNNANRTKQQKLNVQYEANVKKISDGYAKETKDIASQIDKLTKETDGLEAKIRKLLSTYQAAAKTSPLLHDAIEKIKTAIA
jgi:hypothetical protein